ncbi:hypothetical protein QBC33DRAFT_554196 [Phialemonium atrogriseum]|uniref:Uncharacterized protein n=1 Tax=Phialemonium atrogriseum TaxID=1093897 RepID=A0AAJ0FM00_9PEZI|nr:uncharacterized protein QBC33DRAFT_554196 [Phialemonium atrogriseum]KAK1772752.1 hypothetical protein QBC33DRAFT_554196 [Phialemonium atrogriseum]
MTRTLNLSNVVHDTSSNVAKSRAASLSLDKRDDLDCLNPDARVGAANVEDCNNVCSNFLDYPTVSVHILALDVAIWELGACQFGVANRDPCSPTTLTFGVLISYCQGMLGECVINGLDGYYHVSSRNLAMTLTGDGATPRYSAGPCADSKESVMA